MDEQNIALRWQDANNQWQQLTNNLGMAIQLAQEAISNVDKRQVMVQASIEYQCKVLQDVEALREYIYSLLTALAEDLSNEMEVQVLSQTPVSPPTPSTEESTKTK